MCIKVRITKKEKINIQIQTYDKKAQITEIFKYKTFKNPTIGVGFVEFSMLYLVMSFPKKWYQYYTKLRH